MTAKHSPPSDAISLAPQGPWETRRRIALPTFLPENTGKIEAALMALPGVRALAVDSERRQLTVRYDPCQTLFHELLENLRQAGHPPAADWWSRCKGDWYQYLDINARRNAKAPPPPCCSKPPR